MLVITCLGLLLSLLPKRVSRAGPEGVPLSRPTDDYWLYFPAVINSCQPDKLQIVFHAEREGDT